MPSSSLAAGRTLSFVGIPGALVPRPRLVEGERTMPRLRWGIKTSPQHTTYDAMVDVWRAADRTPVFEHAWLFDHFNPIQGSLDGSCFEGWTMLSALAAQTERLRLGLMVAGNTYRHPAVHAHMAA